MQEFLNDMRLFLYFGTAVNALVVTKSSKLRLPSFLERHVAGPLTDFHVRRGGESYGPTAYEEEPYVYNPHFVGLIREVCQPRDAP